MAEDKKLGVQVSETLAVEPAKLAIVDLSYNPSQSTSKITNKVLSELRRLDVILKAKAGKAK